MKTVSSILHDNETLEIPLKIFSTGPMKISEWGEIEPSLKLECDFEMRGKTYKIQGGNLEYWPED